MPIRAPSDQASTSTISADDLVGGAEGERRVLRDPLVEDVPRRQPEARGEEEDDPAGEEEEAGDEPGQARDQSAAQGGSRAHARTLDESELANRAVDQASEQDERPEDPDASSEDAHEPILQRARSRSIAPAYGIGKAALRTRLGETSLVAATVKCAFTSAASVRCGRGRLRRERAGAAMRRASSPPRSISTKPATANTIGPRRPFALESSPTNGTSETAVSPVA